MINIPIYRAKTINQDYNEWEECEQLKRIDGIWYAIGFYDCKREIKTYLGDWEITHLILIRKSTSITEVSTAEIIDISTLSIHFPDMLDSQGSKIFASLDRYYIKGADILENSNFLGDYSLQVAIYSEGCFYAQDKDGEQYNLCENWEKLKVIGIQE